MAFSFASFKKNFRIYFDIFYSYLMKFIYYGSVPAIIMYGLFSKPRSPIVMSAWYFLTG